MVGTLNASPRNLRKYLEGLTDNERKEGAKSTADVPGLVEQYLLVLHRPDEGSEEDGESRCLVLMTPARQSALDTPETTGIAQGLVDHTESVARQARKIADALGLEASLKEAIVKAGEWHDCGKNRLVWQQYACNPDPHNPLAKSTKYRHGGFLGGFRHEFGSLLEAAADPQITDHPERDLILHLIAAHHGWARRLIFDWTGGWMKPAATD